MAHKKYIHSDKDMKVYLPANESEQILSLLTACNYVTPSVCATDSRIVILAKGEQNHPLKSTAIVTLESGYLTEGLSVYSFTILGSFVFGIVFLFIAMGIRLKARILRENLAALNKIVKEISVHLEVPLQLDQDNLVHMSRSLEQIREQGNLLSARITKYKEWLTRHSTLNEFQNQLSHASHDIRGPLEEGRDLLNHLPKMITTLPSEKLHEVLRSASTRFQEGINALNSALDSTKHTSHSDLKIDNVISDILSKTLATDKFKVLRITSAIDPKLKDSFFTIAQPELESIIWNLAQNSLEAHASTLHLELEYSDGKAIISLSDDGSGVPEWLIPDIFSEFVTTKRSGTGIGLASIRQTLNMAGGKIELKPSNKGAVFSIELPVQKEAKNV